MEKAPSDRLTPDIAGEVCIRTHSDAVIAGAITHDGASWPASAIKQRSSVVYFEYTGKSAMTVVGPISGMTYRFPAPGSRAAVDLRDHRHVAAVPTLVQVRSL